MLLFIHAVQCTYSVQYTVKKYTRPVNLHEKTLFNPNITETVSNALQHAKNSSCFVP